MFKCKDCGHCFEFASVMSESRLGGVETFAICPVCKSTSYEEAYKCKACDDYIIEGKYCDGCTEYVKKEFEKFKGGLTDEEYELFQMLVNTGEIVLIEEDSDA